MLYLILWRLYLYVGMPFKIFFDIFNVFIVQLRVLNIFYIVHLHCIHPSTTYRSRSQFLALKRDMKKECFDT